MYHRRKSGLIPYDDGHIDACTQVLVDIIGVIPRLYRAPWGWLSPWEVYRLRRRGLEVIGWDVDTFDWVRPPDSANRIAERAISSARPGSIFMFHDGLTGVDTLSKPHTVGAVERVIQALSEQGYQFVTIPHLLGLDPYHETVVEGGRLYGRGPRWAFLRRSYGSAVTAREPVRWGELE